MPEPAKDVAKRTDVPTDWPRLLARLSAASAFVCFTLNCVVNQLMLKNPQPGRDWVWTAADAASVGVIVLGILFNFTLGLWFSLALVGLAAGYILYYTSAVLHHFRTDQHVAAALELFAAVALMFYYILRILLMRGNR